MFRETERPLIRLRPTVKYVCFYIRLEFRSLFSFFTSLIWAILACSNNASICLDFIFLMFAHEKCLTHRYVWNISLHIYRSAVPRLLDRLDVIRRRRLSISFHLRAERPRKKATFQLNVNGCMWVCFIRFILISSKLSFRWITNPLFNRLFRLDEAKTHTKFLCRLIFSS